MIVCSTVCLWNTHHQVMRTHLIMNLMMLSRRSSRSLKSVWRRPQTPVPDADRVLYHCKESELLTTSLSVSTTNRLPRAGIGFEDHFCVHFNLVKFIFSLLTLDSREAKTRRGINELVLLRNALTFKFTPSSIRVVYWKLAFVAFCSSFRAVISWWILINERRKKEIMFAS